jgi:hypothetical protein
MSLKNVIQGCVDCIGYFKIRSLGGFGKMEVSSETSGFVKTENIFN